MRDAVLLDATAAQMADRGLSVMQRMLNQILLREGYRVTTARYSAGYGDLPLAFQKTLYQALHLEELGIRMLESYMLEPEKTVLAIAGVKSIEN